MPMFHLKLIILFLKKQESIDKTATNSMCEMYAFSVILLLFQEEEKITLLEILTCSHQEFPGL